MLGTDDVYGDVIRIIMCRVLQLSYIDIWHIAAYALKLVCWSEMERRYN